MSTTNLSGPIAVDASEMQSVYCNQVSLSLSLNDIRIYLCEAAPKNVLAGQLAGTLKLAEPHIKTHFSMVVSPEFARGLAKAIKLAVDKYEQTYGPLRAEPSMEDLTRAIESQK